MHSPALASMHVLHFHHSVKMSWTVARDPANTAASTGLLDGIAGQHLTCCIPAQMLDFYWWRP